MKSAIMLVAAGLAVAFRASAQQPESDEVRSTRILAYYKCVKTYAARLAKTPERPTDIATAATASCGHFIPAHERDPVEVEGRKVAVWAVMEARYPNAK